jgi:hypothetical protein
MLAVACLARRPMKAGLVNDTISECQSCGDYSHDAYLLTVRAGIKQRCGQGDSSEADLLQALDLARAQSARYFELRAATALARLWQEQGKVRDGYDLLAPVYGWLTEGLDTPHLRVAKALLEELGAYE